MESCCRGEDEEGEGGGEGEEEKKEKSNNPNLKGRELSRGGGVLVAVRKPKTAINRYAHHDLLWAAPGVWESTQVAGSRGMRPTKDRLKDRRGL